MGILSLILFLLVFSRISEAANILYAVPFTAKSHYIVLKPIGIELARRGHNVTVIAGHREPNPPPNYRQIIVDQREIWEVLGGERPNVFTMVDIPAEQFHEKILWAGGLGITEMALNTSDVQKFLAEDNHFDLVISEQFFQEAFYILAHKYNCPLVLVTTFGNCVRHNIITRNPLQLATVVSDFLDLKEPTSFWSRLRNLYFTVYEYVWWKYWYLEKQEQLVKKYIHNLPQPPVPSLFEMQRNASLILINGHFSFDTPTAYLPNVVEIGGMHLFKSDSKLPEDLQKLLDKAVHGVVYVNFGSNVRSTELPTEKKNAFLNVFRGLKQTVIWKWEDDNMHNKPDNLVLRKWLPQKEILSHPNVKLFISHGGLISTQEAAFHGVPVIGVPIYADQYNNLLQIEKHGFGKVLEYKYINEKTLQGMVDELLNDETYRIMGKEVSTRFKDRPLSAIDTALFWIEYVIRNKGANYMKNPARDLSWMAYNMLDVYLFIAFIVMFSIYVIHKLVQLLTKISVSNSSLNKKKRA